MRQTVPSGALEILIVDDDSTMRVLYSAFLEEAGYRVWGAANLEEASRLVSQRSFGIILCDIHLEGAEDDGRLLFARLPDTKPQPRIIFVTGDALNHGAKSAIPAGTFGVLTKGMDLEKSQKDLLEMIRRAEQDLRAEPRPHK
jgi:DNA-binding NtrC family response regulator